MPRITKITTQKNNKERFNIFLDDGNGRESYGFSVDEAVLVKFQLQKGLEIDELDLTEIKFDDEIKKATNTALHFLSHRMRSKNEIMAYLKRKEVDEPIIQEVLHKLYDYNYVNDQDFANAYVRTQINTTLKGPEIIKKELVEKGVERPVIDVGLQQFSKEQQIEAALKIIAKTASKSTKLSEFELKQKQEQTLMRKGYQWDVIQIAIEESDIEKDQDAQMEALMFQGEKAHKKYQRYEGIIYKQKMKQALYRKGFSIDEIDKFLEHMEDEKSNNQYKFNESNTIGMCSKMQQKRYSQMSEFELNQEIAELKEKARKAEQLGIVNELAVLERKVAMAKAYLLNPKDYLPGETYSIEESPGSTFRITYLNGVFAWGHRDGGATEEALPISLLKAKEATS